MSNLRDFYTFPEISSQPPYIRWIEDPKLQRYIQKLDNLNVDAIAYYLVTTAPSPASNACLTAFLATLPLSPPIASAPLMPCSSNTTAKILPICTSLAWK
jgi:hypothetical protein